jgi:hypothetical protein
MKIGREVAISYTISKDVATGSAAAECSNQADLHLTFTDLI